MITGYAAASSDLHSPLRVTPCLAVVTPLVIRSGAAPGARVRAYSSPNRRTRSGLLLPPRCRIGHGKRSLEVPGPGVHSQVQRFCAVRDHVDHTLGVLQGAADQQRRAGPQHRPVAGPEPR